MTTLELLEDRICKIEEQFYGFERAINSSTENSVVDNLSHVNTLLSSALSGREKMSAVVKRLPELGTYLDPLVEDSELPADAKLQLLLAAQSEVKENHSLLLKMQELMPVLEDKDISNMPEFITKLDDLSVKYVEKNDLLGALSSNVNELVSKYNDVITSVSKSLITMDSAVTTAELAAMPEKQLD